MQAGHPARYTGIGVKDIVDSSGMVLLRGRPLGKNQYFDPLFAPLMLHLLVLLVFQFSVYKIASCHFSLTTPDNHE